MPDSVIKVENLSKRYILAHDAEGAGGRFRYKRFSDALVQTALAPFRALQKKQQPNPSREEFWALNDVSFEVKPGEVVGIIGRNGAGKSTLLKILSRITDPTKGRIEIDGRVASLLEVGTGFHPELTGRENIYLNGAILGMTRTEIKRKFDEIVAFAQVEKFLDTPVKYFSSGMYVRLAFSVAAHLEPEILIVDEVLAVGDAEFQKKCLGKMESVAQQDGRTVLFVSHNLAAVRQLCKRVVLLDKGRIVFDGPTATGLKRYSEMAGMLDDKPRWMIEPPAAPKFPLWLKRASLHGTEGHDGHLLFDEPLTVKFDFVSKEPTREVVVGLVLFGEEGNPLLAINNHYLSYVPFPEPVTTGQVICELGSVPLMPGRYTISLWTGLTVDTCQVIEYGLAFTVSARDVWGTGRLPPENASPLWWPTKFTLVPGSSN